MAAPLRSRSLRTSRPAPARAPARQPLPRTKLPNAARVTDLHDPLPPVIVLDPDERAAPAGGSLRVEPQATGSLLIDAPRVEARTVEAAPSTEAPARVEADGVASTSDVDLDLEAEPTAAAESPGAAPTIRRRGAAERIDLTEASPQSQLDDALADLTEVFALHAFRSTMPACRHCVTEDDRRALARHPADIPGDVLSRFVTKSLITWGEVPDLKRLLPEILTRTTDGRLDVPPGLVGARLRRAEWREWPAAEAPAVRRTLRAAWLTALSTDPEVGRPPITRTLALVASAEDDLRPYLDAWEDRLEAPGNPGARLTAVLHLAEMLAPLAAGGRRRLGRSLPLARRGVVGQLDHWLRQPAVVQRLLHAADALEGTEHAELIVSARRGLARLRTDS